MTDIKTAVSHPTASDLADLLSGNIEPARKKELESHVASCSGCLADIVSAHESVKCFSAKQTIKKGVFMKKINIYFILAAISFALSFFMPRYFIQFLVVTVIFGMKWIIDAKSTKMLIMIYEAWKSGGEKEASRIIKTMDIDNKRRF